MTPPEIAERLEALANSLDLARAIVSNERDTLLLAAVALRERDSDEASARFILGLLASAVRKGMRRDSHQQVEFTDQLVELVMSEAERQVWKAARRASTEK